jgi:NAD(P)-dependent dehydrogenase (short-subunit alcohol dehydrogenase family)
VIWGRRRDRNEQAAEQLRAHGGRVLSMEVDVSDEQQVVDGMQAAVAELGRIDCVIPNAGFSTHPPSFLELTSPLWHELLGTSLHGVYYTLREGVRHMVERSEQGDPGGSIITCGSLAITQGRPGIQHYAAAKGAIASVTRGIAVEYGPHGIRANMVLPGRFATALGGEKTPEQEQAAEAAMAPVPIARRGRADEVQGIAVYLMSDASSYHTGDMITIDGGHSITLV